MTASFHEVVINNPQASAGWSTLVVESERLTIYQRQVLVRVNATTSCFIPMNMVLNVTPLSHYHEEHREELFRSQDYEPFQKYEGKHIILSSRRY